MIKRPPAKDQLPDLPYSYLRNNHSDKFDEYFAYYRVVDEKGQYFHFDELRRRLPRELDEKLVWALTKLARGRAAQHLFYMGEPTQSCTFIATPKIQKVLTLVDQSTTTSALEWTMRKIGEESHFNYLLNDLVEDESISSSQLEGAATTNIIAKDMLKRKREPRSIDEKMIFGNFKMMQFAWDNRSLPITLDLIRDMHRAGVEGIDDEKYSPGQFRASDDDVVVVDKDGDVAHRPPPAKNIQVRLDLLFDWINSQHDEIESDKYIHPLIKAICIHFMIGYEHPFKDGNGRVARSLFYWFMFRKNYGAFRYISISSLLKKAATSYGKSYLYTETDEMDLTYFIDYQSSVIIKAVSEFKSHCEKAISDIENFNNWLWATGIYSTLSDKQKTVFQVAKSGLTKQFTITNVKENLACSYNTASAVLNGLVALNLFKKQKEGKEWTYSLCDKKEIQKNWIPPK